jgi:hypothetical protein
MPRTITIEQPLNIQQADGPRWRTTAPEATP